MTLLLAALTILAVSALLALLGSRRPPVATAFGLAGSVAGGVTGALPALDTLRGGVPLTWAAPWPVPGGALTLHLDPLAAFFLLPIALLPALCAVYAAGYLKGHSTRGTGRHWFFFNLLAAAMILVVTAANAVLFLAAWEVMTLASFFLVASDHRDAEVRKAAWLYLVLAHLGLIFLLAFFAYCGGHSGGFDFAALAAPGAIPPAAATVLFALAVAGFGVKAGLFPLHVWLPDAHPAAPSHVSALMSGVLVKTGIYGILRVYTLLPPVSAGAGTVLMALGGTGALYGIAMACFQRDIKRSLAYSTVENVGIIFLGLGLALRAAASGEAAVAALALAGALLHIWNHALFKGLMFLGAGSLVHATGTRDMDELGGLLKRLPWTSALLIGGSLAIAALPPFNGLVSEWLIYLGLLRAGTGSSGLSALLPLLMTALLALTGALAVVAFTRLTGISLLGLPRSTAAAEARESSPLMLAPMVLLLLMCAAIGLAPQGAAAWLSRPLQELLPGTGGAIPALLPLAPLGHWGWGLLLALALAVSLLRVLRRIRPVATGATWGCGFPFPTSRMAYTGEAFAELAQNHLLPAALRPEVTSERPSGLFPVAARLAQRALDPVLVRLVFPAVEALARRCQRLRFLQQGKSQVYLFYIFASCAALMVWSVIEGGH